MRTTATPMTTNPTSFVLSKAHKARLDHISEFGIVFEGFTVWPSRIQLNVPPEKDIAAPGTFNILVDKALRSLKTTGLPDPPTEPTVDPLVFDLVFGKETTITVLPSFSVILGNPPKPEGQKDLESHKRPGKTTKRQIDITPESPIETKKPYKPTIPHKPSRVIQVTHHQNRDPYRTPPAQDPLAAFLPKTPRVNKKPTIFDFDLRSATEGGIRLSPEDNKYWPYNQRRLPQYDDDEKKNTSNPSFPRIASIRKSDGEFYIGSRRVLIPLPSTLHHCSRRFWENNTIRALELYDCKHDKLFSYICNFRKEHYPDHYIKLYEYHSLQDRINDGQYELLENSKPKAK
jgi:hypothetical protein